MRNLVPTLAIVLGLSFGGSARAEDDSLPPLDEIIKNAGCRVETNGETVREIFVRVDECNAIEDAYCPLSGAKGCKNPKPNAGEEFRSLVPFKSADAKALDQAIAKSSDFLKVEYERADTCCNNPNGDACKNNFDKTTSDAFSKVLEVDPVAGTKDAHLKSADANTLRSRGSARVAGYCSAYREVCIGHSKALMKELENQEHCNTSACPNAQSDIKKISVQCEQLNPQKNREQAKNFGEAADKSIEASKLADASSSTPASTNANTPNSSSNPSSTKPASASTGSGMNPMSILGPVLQALTQQQQQQQQPQTPTGATPDCSSTPSLAGCAVAATKPTTSWNTASTGTLTSNSNKAATGGFNVGANSGIQPAALGANQNPGGGTPVTTKAIGGGGGGGVPGGGSGGSASLGGGSTGQASLGPGGKTTDILHGEGGQSGYSQMASGMNMQSGSGGGGYTYGGPTGDSSSSSFHLADFLPGGKHDPSRAPAGASAPVEIQSQSVNIWNRISEHIRSRCAQGLLRDCGPQ